MRFKGSGWLDGSGLPASYQHWRIGAPAIARETARETLSQYRATYMAGWVDERSRELWVKEQQMIAGHIRAEDS